MRADANLDHAVENLVDGAFFNSGQCCCGIERIYVHENVYDQFVEGFVETARRAGRSAIRSTRRRRSARWRAPSFADLVREQTAEALRKGAKAHVNRKHDLDEAGSPYLAPEVLTNVNHQMAVMREESFGPVVGIMKVRDDDEAIDADERQPLRPHRLDLDRGPRCAPQRSATRSRPARSSANRCDYLDPALVWTGVKDTGRGAALSQIGYEPDAAEELSSEESSRHDVIPASSVGRIVAIR